MGVTNGTLTGSPSAGQVVKFYKSPTYAETASTTTDGTGKYLITLAAGTYKATATTSDQPCLPATFVIPTGTKIQNLSYPALADDDGEPPCGCPPVVASPSVQAYLLIEQADPADPDAPSPGPEPKPPQNPFKNMGTYNKDRYKYVYYTSSGELTSTLESQPGSGHKGIKSHGKRVRYASLFVYDMGDPDFPDPNAPAVDPDLVAWPADNAPATDDGEAAV